MYQVIWTFKRFLKNQKIAMSKLYSNFCPFKRYFPRVNLSTRNKKWSPEFSERRPLNRGFPLNQCPLNRFHCNWTVVIVLLRRCHFLPSIPWHKLWVSSFAQMRGWKQKWARCHTCRVPDEQFVNPLLVEPNVGCQHLILLVHVEDLRNSENIQITMPS